MFNFQPFATGTAVLVTTLLTALRSACAPRMLFDCGAETLRQLRVPSVVVFFIVGMAFLFNYSGMVYTLGAALAGTGVFFPLVSSFLGWVACFLTGSDTSSNFLFGNLQVAAAQQLHLNPILLAATNSSGAVAGKMISPQNIAIGVSTVGLVGHEGEVLRSTFWHSVLFATFIGGIASRRRISSRGRSPDRHPSPSHRIMIFPLIALSHPRCCSARSSLGPSSRSPRKRPTSCSGSTTSG